MTKCPNCGSTAQVKFIKTTKSYFCGGASSHYHNYKCGCGCYFFEAINYDDTSTEIGRKIHLWHKEVDE